MVLSSQERQDGMFVPGYWENEQERDRPPSLDEILTLFKEGRQYFQGLHGQCRIAEEYFRGQRTVPAPEGIDPVWPGTASAIVNIATDHVDVNNLSIDVPSSPRAKARAERLKKFYQGAWQSFKTPVLRTSVAQSFLYGIAFRKTMFDTDKWPNAPHFDDFGDDLSAYKTALEDFMDMRCITWPIDECVIRPVNLVWDDSKTRMKWAIEFYERPITDIKKRYPEWMPTADMEMNGCATWMEYWDEEWCGYLVDNQFIWGPYKHGYGFLPYTKIVPSRSYTYDDGPPHERYTGILEPVKSLLDEEARLATQIQAIIRTIAWRTVDFQGPRSLAEEAMQNYEMFGAKNFLPPGVSVQLSPMGQVPPDLYQQLATVQNYIEAATFPNVVRGMRPRGVSAGFGISVLAGMGRLVFQAVADGIQRSIEESNMKFAKLVENKVKGRLTVHGRSDVNTFDQSIEPDDIRGMYENIVKVKAEAPEEREREALLAMRLQAAQIISMSTAQLRAGITNPLEEQMQIRAEQLLNNEQMLQAQMQMLFEQMGLGEQMGQAISPQMGGGGNVGSMNLGGAQLPRPGEGMIQQARVASQQGQPSVYPQGQAGIDSLGNVLGNPGGGPVNMPSGQRLGG